jgi:hypothetical protein
MPTGVRVYWEAARAALIHPSRMQEINIVTRMRPTVYHAEGSGTVYLTFEGLRDSRTITDKLTRVRIAMPATEAVHFWQQLADDVPAGG